MVIKKIILDVESPRYKVLAGRQGENGVTAVQIDCTDYIVRYGEGTPSLVCKNPNEDTPYSVPLIRDGAFVTWVVGIESTSVCGLGRAVLLWYPNSGGEAKTADIEFQVDHSSSSNNAVSIIAMIEHLREQIEQIQNEGIDNDAIQRIIGDYLAEHPIEGITADAVILMLADYVKTGDLNSAISNYVNEHKAELKGDKGDTGPQGIQGPVGATGATGMTGPKGDKGDTGATGPKGDTGDRGATGQKGDKGDKGDPFTYDDFTPEQLEALRGPKGDKGDPGTGGTGGATDVRINGTSITTDGVANIPIATASKYGAVKVDEALSPQSTNPVQNKAVVSAINSRVAVVAGKGLSSNDYTDDDKAKVDAIPSDLDNSLILINEGLSELENDVDGLKKDLNDIRGQIGRDGIDYINDALGTDFSNLVEAIVYAIENGGAEPTPVEPIDISAIPEYWHGEINDALAYVDSLGSGYVSHVVLTDSHYNTNNKKGTTIANYLFQSGKFDKFINIGDIVESGTVTDNNYLGCISDGMNRNNRNMLLVTGNHDTRLDKATVFSDFMGKNRSVRFAGNGKYDWVYDDNTNKIRYIGLDMGNGWNTDFLRNSVTSIPNGYSYAIIMHYTLPSANSEWTMSHTEENESIILGIVESSDRPFIGFFTGHQHIDETTQLEDKAYHTTLYCDKWENTKYYSYYSYPSRLGGTTNESAITILSINPTTKNVKVYRVGTCCNAEHKTWEYTYEGIVPVAPPEEEPTEEIIPLVWEYDKYYKATGELVSYSGWKACEIDLTRYTNIQYLYAGATTQYCYFVDSDGSLTKQSFASTGGRYLPLNAPSGSVRFLFSSQSTITFEAKNMLQ